MTDATYTTRDLFTDVAGEYPTYGALMDRLVEVYGAHAHQIPALFGMNRLLEIGRERGWIIYDQGRDILVVSTESGR